MRDRRTWVFDDFEVDLSAWRLLKAGTPISLEPKALALLGLLIERRSCRKDRTCTALDWCSTLAPTPWS